MTFILEFVVSAINWVVFGWLFWPLLILFLWLPHFPLKDEGNDNFEGGLLFVLLLLTGLCYWRWPSVFPSTEAGWASAAAIYLIVGFFVSLSRYLRVLRDFRYEVTAAKAKVTLSNRDEGVRFPCRVRDAMGYNWSGKIVILDNDSGLALNWRRLPLSNWWIYWPWFALSSIFDFIGNLGTWLVNRFRGLYDTLADKFSVKL